MEPFDLPWAFGMLGRVSSMEFSLTLAVRLELAAVPKNITNQNIA